MCSSKSKPIAHTSISDINGRPVLEPATANRSLSLLERRRKSICTYNKKSSPSPSPSPILNYNPKPAKLSSSSSSTPTTPDPISPKLKSPRPPAIKRSGNININNNDLNSSTTGEKHIISSSSSSSSTTTTPTLSPRCVTKSSATSKTLKKSKQCGASPPGIINNTNSTTTTTIKDFPAMPGGLDISFLIAEAPGSIAAARREQVAIMQVQRKMKTAHYGRTLTKSKSATKYQGSMVSLPTLSMADNYASSSVREETKRCSFITTNSDPIYIAYHDEEWGIPVHDDKMLFELLILTAAQLGSNWTSVLKKRQHFREAFSGFDAEIVSAYSEKKITSIVADYGIELSQVRGAVDNANRILLIRKEFGTLDKYMWSFVNQKAMQTQYKSMNKIPVKTSKSESMSKDLVRRGFRYVGATVMLSFMQAAGLTNDHLVDCPRHQHCCVAAGSTSLES